MKIHTVFSIHTASCTHIIRNMYRNALKHTVKETDSHVSVAVNPAHVQEYSHIRMSNGICGYFLKHLAQTIHFQVIMLISSATPRLQWNQLYANHITHKTTDSSIYFKVLPLEFGCMHMKSIVSSLTLSHSVCFIPFIVYANSIGNFYHG